MPLGIEYKIGVKREVVTALKPIFGNSYPDEQLRNRVWVSQEYPLRETAYPAIFVTFSEGPVENVGIGHYELDFNINSFDPSPDTLEDQYAIRKFAHWKFRGAINFNILARSPEDRDMISAALVQIIGMGEEIDVFRPFYEEVYDSDWLDLALMTERINPTGESTTPAPWNDEELVYVSSYSVDVFGEFYSDTTTGDLVRISTVHSYPYYADSPLPESTFANDPAEWYPPLSNNEDLEQL